MGNATKGMALEEWLKLEDATKASKCAVGLFFGKLLGEVHLPSPLHSPRIVALRVSRL